MEQFSRNLVDALTKRGYVVDDISEETGSTTYGVQDPDSGERFFVTIEPA